MHIEGIGCVCILYDWMISFITYKKVLSWTVAVKVRLLSVSLKQSVQIFDNSIPDR